MGADLEELQQRAFTVLLTGDCIRRPLALKACALSLNCMMLLLITQGAQPFTLVVPIAEDSSQHIYTNIEALLQPLLHWLLKQVH